jgi:hypothetical protein
MLTEENHREIILSIHPEQWQPLLDLIPEIEQSTTFGELKGGGKNPDGSIAISYWVCTDIVNKVINEFGNLGVLVGFNWAKWEEGLKLLSLKNWDYNEVDIPTCCKLVSAIIRKDRFYEGAIVEAFEKGIFLNILRAIEFHTS